MPNPISKLLSFGDGKRLRQYRQKVDKVNALEAGLLEKTDEELRAMADHLRERATAGEANEKLLPESFALVREASKRTVGLRHYDVQLIGGMALNDGCVAEMKTGEGKTLVSTAAGFLNALAGDPVHVVTVNDYLAKRDAEWVGRIYRLLGMEVGLIQNGMEPADRRPAYAAAVTYGTNSEFGFDYLRDNMVSTPADRVQRGHAFAVVDEADSVLIDEARTPLIISGLAGAPSEICNNFAEIAAKLDPEEDIVLDEKRRTVYETEAGLAKIEKMLGAEVYADLTGATANRLRQALKAQFLFKLDHDYVVDKGEVKIVDSFTGRIMEGRRYSEGLHQAIEAKEHVEIKPETRTIATVTLQNYFRLYKKLSGMTGTALTADSELDHIYHMPVVPVPTNRPVIREDKGDLVYRTADAKFAAVADEVERRHAKGQPVLVGTASVKASERLSKLLDERGTTIRCSTPRNTSARPRSSPRPAARAPSPSPPTWQAAAPTSCSAGTTRSSARPRSRSTAPKARKPPRSGSSTRPTPRRGTSPTARATPCACSAGCASSAPSATRRGASTTSCAGAPVGRATRANRDSTCRSRTTFCACSARSAYTRCPR